MPLAPAALPLRTARAALVALAALLAPLAVPPAAAQTSELPSFEREVFNDLVGALAAGDWGGLMDAVDPGGQIARETRDQIAQNMSRVAPYGFSGIRVLQQADPGPALSTLALTLEGEGGTIFMYVAAIDSSAGWRVGHFTFNNNFGPILELIQ